MSTPTTRRSVLGRLGLVLAGLGGAGAGSAGATRIATPEPAPRAISARRLVLHAPALRTAPGLHDPRAPRTATDPFGDLVDEHRRAVGSFRTQSVGHGSLHVFTLDGGLLLGLGAGGLEGTAHAVVGGTGRFAGAGGSYSVAADADQPGRGVTFTFTLHQLTLEA